MATREDLLAALAPVSAFVRTLDLQDPPRAVAALRERFPLEGDELTRVRALLREGVEARWVADRENEGIRFSRLQKAGDDGLSIDVVHMDKPGPGHTHPNGEVDLCFAVSGAPKFDGNEPGWTVYPPGSWHVPTVEGGVMDIVYFLPNGAIEFGPRPGSA